MGGLLDDQVLVKDRVARFNAIGCHQVTIEVRANAWRCTVMLLSFVTLGLQNVSTCLSACTVLVHSSATFGFARGWRDYGVIRWGPLSWRERLCLDVRRQAYALGINE